MTTQRLTPLPWAVWKLSPDSDRRQRHIIVTADGEQEITGIVHREADAHHIVHCVNSHHKLREAVQSFLNLVRETTEIDAPFIRLDELDTQITLAELAITEATGNMPPEPRKPIVIEVHGGVVQDVLNVPPGYECEIRDYDNIEAGAEIEAGRPV